jgi:hypothetical protein
MKTYGFFDMVLMSPEGGSGGLSAAAEAGGEPPAAGNASAGQPSGWTPPAGIPADYLGSTADETLARLLPAFTEAQSRAEGLRQKLSTLPKAPDTVDGYTFEPDDKLKPYFSDLSQNKAWDFARAAAKEVGLSPEQLQKFVGGVYGPMVDAGLLAPPYDPQTEVQTFQTSMGLDRTQTVAALKEAEAFASGLAGQLKGVPEAMRPDVNAMLASLTDTAAGNALLRALSARLAENGIRIAGQGGTTALTDADVQKLHSDPRIDPRNRDHADPNRRFDPDLRARYDEASNRPRR